MASPVHVEEAAAAAELESAAGFQQPDVPASRRSGAPRWFVRGAQLLLLALLLGGWQFLSSRSHPATPLAGPWDVARTLGTWSTDGERWHDVWVTLKEAAIGWVVGAALGVVVAYTLAFVNPIARLLNPVVAAFENALPKITLAPLFIIWFGTGTKSKVAFVVSVVFFVVFYAVFEGLRSIDRSFIINAKILGASPVRMLKEVYAPAVFGWLMSSLRLSTTFALLLAVVGEFVASQDGIGHTISTGQQRFQSDTVLAGIWVVAAMALILDRALVAIESRVSRWKVS